MRKPAPVSGRAATLSRARLSMPMAIRRRGAMPTRGSRRRLITKPPSANGCSITTRSAPPPIPTRCSSASSSRAMPPPRTSADGTVRTSNANPAFPAGRARCRTRAMAEFFEALTDDHRAFIARQPVFFVATAAEGARVNLSPKGMDCFRVLDERTVAWLDVAGSGNETNAHLLADGRITIMFCAFDNPALILRIYGRGTPVLPQDQGWADTA